LKLRLLCWFHNHVTAAAAAVHKLDSAGNFGKERIVLAPTNIGAGLDARATLAHDDGAAGYKLSAERPFLELPKPFLCAMT
jgi:hypothetical protein